MRDFSFVVQKKRRKIHRMQKNIGKTFLFNFLLWIDTYYIYWKCCERNSTTFSSNTTFQIFFQNFSKTRKSQMFFSRKSDGFGGWKYFFRKLRKIIFLWTAPLRGSREIPQAPSSWNKLFCIIIGWMSEMRVKKRLWLLAPTWPSTAINFFLVASEGHQEESWVASMDESKATK